MLAWNTWAYTVDLKSYYNHKLHEMKQVLEYPGALTKGGK